MFKVVIDTNVFISSLFGGNPRKVINLWRDNQIKICLSEAIVKEYFEVLARFSLKTEMAREIYLMLYERENSCEVVPEKSLRIIENDLADNKFLECAVSGRADYIVSGDKHLLDLGKYEEIKILSPKVFLDILLKNETF